MSRRAFFSKTSYDHWNTTELTKYVPAAGILFLRMCALMSRYFVFGNRPRSFSFASKCASRCNPHITALCLFRTWSNNATYSRTIWCYTRGPRFKMDVTSLNSAKTMPVHRSYSHKHTSTCTHMYPYMNTHTHTYICTFSMPSAVC